MNNRKIIVAVFLAGLLMIGIGSGITFAEFTALSYGGDINLSGEMKRVNLQTTLPENTKAVQFYINGYDSGKISVIGDSTLAKDQISIEVVCDQEQITPYLHDEGELTLDGKASGESAAAYLLSYRYRGTNRDTFNFFKVKDDLLEGLKERKIYSYSNDYVQEVIIKAAPELVEHIMVER